jgi:hypothetical protein
MSTVRMMVACGGKEVFNADHRKVHVDKEHKAMHERYDSKIEFLAIVAALTDDASKLDALLTLLLPVCGESRRVNDYVNARDELKSKLEDGVIANKFADFKNGTFSEKGLFTPVSSARLDKTESIYEPARIGL